MSRRIRCPDGKQAGFASEKLHFSKIFGSLFSTHFRDYSDLRIRLFALSTTEVSSEAR